MTQTEIVLFYKQKRDLGRFLKYIIKSYEVGYVKIAFKNLIVKLLYTGKIKYTYLMTN